MCMNINKMEYKTLKNKRTERIKSDGIRPTVGQCLSGTVSQCDSEDFPSRSVVSGDPASSCHFTSF